jgi:SAM-dependent methyltransferase
MEKEQPSGRYDRLWRETWGDMQRAGPVHIHQRRILLRVVRRISVVSVLDVGCGSGENLRALAAVSGLKLFGADVSAAALTLARQRVPSAHLVQLDVQREKLPERFDLVMAIQVLEHLEDDVSALRHMAQMADHWVIATTMVGRMRQSERRIGHIRNYTFAELRDKASLAELEVVDLFGWGFPLYSPLYRTLVEFLPGGPPSKTTTPVSRLFAHLLSALYHLNVPRIGDVAFMLAKPKARNPGVHGARSAS